MGYDLTMNRRPPMPKGDVRDPVHAEAFFAWCGAYTFRFDNASMSAMCRDVLDDVLDWDCESGPPPEFAPEVWAAWEAWETGPDKDGPAPTPEVADARARWDALMATPSPVPGKVPAFKFDTTDGWTVTPGECRILAGHLRARAGRVPAEMEQLVERFADFNERAAEHDGYRVD
jgi:hypothetical protein